MRLPVVLATAVGISLTLVACERVGGLGPVAIQAHEGELRVAICKEIDATEIAMDVRKNEFSLWATFWSDESDIHIESGTILSTAEPALSPTGFKATPRVGPGAEVSVTLRASKPNEDAIVGDFWIPSEGLPTAEWLNPDGSVTREPCGK